jgi:hypothetical protein
MRLLLVRTLFDKVPCTTVALSALGPASCRGSTVAALRVPDPRHTLSKERIISAEARLLEELASGACCGLGLSSSAVVAHQLDELSEEAHVGTERPRPERCDCSSRVSQFSGAVAGPWAVGTRR